VGRRTALTEDVIAKLEEAFALHSPVKTACDYAGISDGCYYRWMQLARGGDKRYVELHERITRARSNSTLNLSRLMHNAADDDWKAALAILERRDPKNWARTTKMHIEYEAELEKLMRRVESLVTPKQYAELVNALAPSAEGEGTPPPQAPAEAGEPIH
jgi:hypothetical protein